MIVQPWYKDSSSDIVGIPTSKKLTPWQSSTETPEMQLARMKMYGCQDEEEVGFCDYEKCDQLARLVEGKRIAFVGPGPNLKGLKTGDLIDSYDLVVRINQAYHTKEHDWQDYGKRTDINVNCLNAIKWKALEGNLEYAQSLKYILCPQVWVSPPAEISRGYDRLARIGVPSQRVKNGYLFKVYKEVGTICNTGLNGIITLLNYDVKELYVTGVTFFNMNTFGKVYNDHYHDEAQRNGNFSSSKDRQPSPAELRMDIHHQQPQIDYFHKIIAFHYKQKLNLDQYLIDNFTQSVEFAKKRAKTNSKKDE